MNKWVSEHVLTDYSDTTSNCDKGQIQILFFPNNIITVSLGNFYRGVVLYIIQLFVDLPENMTPLSVVTGLKKAIR